MFNYNIKVSGQQKVIKVKKAPADKYNPYCVINLEALHKAMNVLHKTAAGLTLWMYIAENQNAYQFALSSTHFQSLTGFGKDAYNSAVKALLDNGYLVPVEGTKQQYIFFENGTAGETNISSKKQWVKGNPTLEYGDDRQLNSGEPDIEIWGEPTRNNTNITNTTNITEEKEVGSVNKKQPIPRVANPDLNYEWE